MKGYKSNIKESEYIDKIDDKIYLGCQLGAKFTDYLSSLGVTHILRLNPEIVKSITKLEHKCLPINDRDEENIILLFKEAFEYIDSSEKVYVHCMAGVSRSATIVIAYLMWKNKWDYYKSYYFVRNRRSVVNPNNGFVKQLQKFELLLKESGYDLEMIKWK